MIDRDTIIKLAREAGMRIAIESVDDLPEVWSVTSTPELERLAAMVAKNEREACAQVCRDIMDDFWTGDERWETARHCSEMILERGKK